MAEKPRLAAFAEAERLWPTQWLGDSANQTWKEHICAMENPSFIVD